MGELKNAGVAIIVLIVGMFSLFQGATPVPESLLDGALIAFGAALVLGYCGMIGDNLNRIFRTESRTIAFAPILFILGVFVSVQAATGAGLTSSSKISLAVPGATLIIASLAIVGKAKIRRGGL